MTDKQKKKPLLFCENCRYYDEDKKKPCDFKTGENVTPIGRTPLYADPEEDNKHNNCPHYEEFGTPSRLNVVLFVFLLSAAVVLLFDSIFVGFLFLGTVLYVFRRTTS